MDDKGAKDRQLSARSKKNTFLRKRNGKMGAPAVALVPPETRGKRENEENNRRCNGISSLSCGVNRRCEGDLGGKGSRGRESKQREKKKTN